MKILTIVFAGLAVLGMINTVEVARASSYQEMKQGVDFYRKGRYHDSLAHFQQARIESPDDPKVWFNLASTQYQTGRYDEAARSFTAVVMQSNDPQLKQKALYNLGNTSFRQGNLQSAVDFYRQAVGLNPSDLEAKQNLEFVLKKLEETKKKEGQEASKKGAERQGDQKAPPSQSDHDQARNNDQKTPKTGQEVKQGAFSPEEAERLLNVVSDDQRAFLQEQARNFVRKGRAREKDW